MKTNTNRLTQIRTIFCILIVMLLSFAVSGQEPATAVWEIQGTTITITASEGGSQANGTEFRLIVALKDNDGNPLNTSTPVRISKVGDSPDIYNVYALAGTATHSDVADAITALSDFDAEITNGSSNILDLPFIQLAEAGVVSAQHDNAEPPEGTSGSFLINDYGTSSTSGNYWYRGYIFEVSSTTIVTHLVSAVTSGGSAGVVLYTADKLATTDPAGNPHIKGNTLLGHVSATGTGSEVTTPIIVNGGGSTVTLVPGQLYLLAQTAQFSGGSGNHVYVSNLNIADLETHPRIKENTWEPRTNNSIRWNGVGDENFIGDQANHHDYDGAMPRIGFLFESDIEFAEISTLSAGISGNEWTFNGNLINTGGTGNEVSLYIEWHTTPDVGNGTLSAATPATTTAHGTSFSHTETVDPNQAYYYRAIAINERGRSNGDLWRVGQTALGNYAFQVSEGTRELQVTGDNAAVGSQVLFDAGASSTSTSWDGTNQKLTLNYVANSTNLNQIRDLITNTATAGLTAVLTDGSSTEIPIVLQTTLDGGVDCISPPDGGEIAGSQNICSGTAAYELTSASEASGQTGGVIEYQWQASTASSSENFSNINEATETTYNPGELTQTTWYRRLARVSCEADWSGAASSNVIEITVDALQQFRSNEDLDWTSTQSWNSASTWKQFNGTDWVDATTYPGEITNACANPLVTIQAGHEIEIATTLEITIPNLEIKDTGKLTIKSGGKLVVQGKVQLDESAGAAIVVE